MIGIGGYLQSNKTPVTIPVSAARCTPARLCRPDYRRYHPGYGQAAQLQTRIIQLFID
jgi:hypothetical protein